MPEVINERTRAIMPVHLYGYMADMAAIMALAADSGLPSSRTRRRPSAPDYHGRPAGSFGVGCFSLYATKNLNTGEGGVVTTNDDAIADRLRLLRNQGMRQRYQYEVAGHNYRLTNLAAAVGLPQLARLERDHARRQANAVALRAGLADVKGLRLPPEPEPDGPTCTTSSRSGSPTTRRSRGTSSSTGSPARLRMRHLLPQGRVRLRLLPDHPRVSPIGSRTRERVRRGRLAAGAPVPRPQRSRADRENVRQVLRG